MQVKVRIDPTIKDPEIIIIAKKNDQFIENLVNMISDYKKKKLSLITGYIGNSAYLINVSDILRIYAANQKVYIQTAESEYLIKYRLYEMEAQLERNQFLRISNSEIVNINEITDIDLSITGKICICLSGNIKTYVSRRYIPSIKKALGI